MSNRIFRENVEVENNSIEKKSFFVKSRQNYLLNAYIKCTATLLSVFLYFFFVASYVHMYICISFTEIQKSQKIRQIELLPKLTVMQWSRAMSRTIFIDPGCQQMALVLWQYLLNKNCQFRPAIYEHPELFLIVRGFDFDLKIQQTLLTSNWTVSVQILIFKMVAIQMEKEKTPVMVSYQVKTCQKN